MVRVSTNTNANRVTVGSNTTANNVNTTNAKSEFYADIAKEYSEKAEVSAQQAKHSADIAIEATDGVEEKLETAVETINAVKKQTLDAMTEYGDIAKDWAIKTDDTVDGEEYSSKYYANQASTVVSESLEEINTAKNNALIAVDAEGDNVKDAITDTRAGAITSIQDETQIQITRIETKGEEVKNSIAGDVESAKLSAQNAKISEDNAKIYRDNASLSASTASTSATTATTQAGIATTKASEASTSASNALSSETKAKTSETNAKTSEDNAFKSAEDAEYWAGQASKGQKQVDWNITDETNVSFIKNKPTIPSLVGYATESYVQGYHDSTKQDVISDLATIRAGASKGATALQTIPIAKANVVGGVAGGNWLTVNQTTGKMECGELTKAQFDSANGYTFIGKTTLNNVLADYTKSNGFKTINGESIVGSGDIEIKSGGEYTAGTNISISDSNVISVSKTIPSTTTSVTSGSTSAITSGGIYTLLTTIYPVGSMFFSTTSTCPLASIFGTWQNVGTSIITSVNSTGSVVGNGMTLGLNNGTYNLGMRPSGGTGHPVITETNGYGVSTGSSGAGGTSPSNNYLGVTTDGSKSGMVANITRTSLTVNIFKRTA